MKNFRGHLKLTWRSRLLHSKPDCNICCLRLYENIVCLCCHILPSIHFTKAAFIFTRVLQWHPISRIYTPVIPLFCEYTRSNSPCKLYLDHFRQPQGGISLSLTGVVWVTSWGSHTQTPGFLMLTPLLSPPLKGCHTEPPPCLTRCEGEQITPASGRNIGEGVKMAFNGEHSK